MTLIDRDALKKQMCKICNENYSDDPCEPNDCVFLNAVDNAPTIDAVPVVRCSECKHRALAGKAPLVYYCTLDKGLASSVRETDFCSYGERRNDDWQNGI